MFNKLRRHEPKTGPEDVVDTDHQNAIDSEAEWFDDGADITLSEATPFSRSDLLGEVTRKTDKQKTKGADGRTLTRAEVHWLQDVNIPDSNIM